MFYYNVRKQKTSLSKLLLKNNLVVVVACLVSKRLNDESGCMDTSVQSLLAFLVYGNVALFACMLMATCLDALNVLSACQQVISDKAVLLTILVYAFILCSVLFDLAQVLYVFYAFFSYGVSPCVELSFLLQLLFWVFLSWALVLAYHLLVFCLHRDQSSSVIHYPFSRGSAPQDPLDYYEMTDRTRA